MIVRLILYAFYDLGRTHELPIIIVIEPTSHKIFSPQNWTLNSVVAPTEAVSSAEKLPLKLKLKLTCIYHIETKLSFLSARHSPVDMTSVILSINPEYRKTLMEFLAPVQVPGKEWEMCYRGSEQNFSASAFHSLCDFKGPTVTVVRVNQNVFGGYNDKNWTTGKNSPDTRFEYHSAEHV